MAISTLSERVPNSKRSRTGFPRQSGPSAAHAAECGHDGGSLGASVTDGDVARFAALLTDEGRRLLGETRPGEDALAASTRLRRTYPAELVATALTQVRLRGRAAEKFGADAARMYFTPDGLEQATRAEVAAHRAARFAHLGAPVADLCCGIGADLIALARAGLQVTGVERDPLTAAVARANIAALALSAGVQLGDATALDPSGIPWTGRRPGPGSGPGTEANGGAEPVASPGRIPRAGHATEVTLGEQPATGPGYAVFCDPARRPSGGPLGTGGRKRRVFDPEAYAPPLSVALDLASRGRGGCVKVAPGIPHDAVPDGAEAEWISWRGEVKEAALWLGALAGRGAGGGVRRRATLLPAGATLTDEPGLGAPAVTDVRRYLYEPDGAVIRAHLVAEVAARVEGALIDPAIAYVAADRPTPTPFARTYEIEDVLPFSLKRLRAVLRERRVGAVTIKKRGSAVDIERLRKDLRLSGDERATVILTRIATRPYAFLAHPA